jgi:hypothetical protein
VLDSGLRVTVDQLGPPDAERWRLTNVARLATHDTDEIEVNGMDATLTE